MTGRIHSLLDPAVRSRWMDLLGRANCTSPFAHPDYLIAAATASGYDAGCLILDDQTAGIPVCTRRLGPFREALPPVFTPFVPFVCVSPLRESDIHSHASQLDRVVDALSSSFARVLAPLPPEIADVRPFQWKKWDAAPRFTYRLSTRGDVAAAWSTAARRVLKKHARAFSYSENPNHAATIARLFSASTARGGGRRSLSEAALAEMIDAVSAAGLCRCFLAEADGIAHAGIAVLMDRDCAYYWVAGSVPGPAMTVLIGHVLQTTGGEGIATFDMVGANTPSIAEFKRKFAPTLVPYFMVSQHRSFWLRFAYWTRGLFRRG